MQQACTQNCDIEKDTFIVNKKRFIAITYKVVNVSTLQERKN